MAALAPQIDFVLPKFIAENFDIQVPHGRYCTYIQSGVKVPASVRYGVPAR
jgi:hypothetical protein